MGEDLFTQTLKKKYKFSKAYCFVDFLIKGFIPFTLAQSNNYLMHQRYVYFLSQHVDSYCVEVELTCCEREDAYIRYMRYLSWLKGKTLEGKAKLDQN
jgi:hypothetical protein